MSDDWDFYLCRVNGEPASIFLDLGARDRAPDPARPMLLFAWVGMRAPRPDGLSSAEEAPTLGAIEDALTPAVEAACGAVFVGRVTNVGRRELYFYGQGTDGFEDAVARALSAFPGYSADTGAKADPEWAHYVDFLFPAERQHQQMKNRQTLQALEEAGDDPAALRAIRHWLYFADAADRALAAQRLTTDGFSVTTSDDPDPSAARPHCLLAERVGSVAADAIDAACFAMLDLVEGRAAEYDGWETEVMRADG